MIVRHFTEIRVSPCSWLGFSRTHARRRSITTTTATTTTTTTQCCQREAHKDQPGAGSPLKQSRKCVLDGSIGSARNNEAKWKNVVLVWKTARNERTNKRTSERKRRKICGTIRGRTRRLPAAALALTVALAPSNTERQTVDSTKAAGTAPLCPPFSSMCPSRALPLLSLSWAVPPSCYLACTYAFLRFFSFCLPVACTSPFSFFAVYFFSRFLLRGSPLSSSFSIRLCLPVNEVQRISCLFSSPRSGFAFVFISRRHTLLTRFFSLCAQFCWRINQATGQQPTSAKAGNRHNAPYQSYQMIGWPLANRPIASRFRSSGGTALSRTPTPATAEKIPGCFDKCINNSKNKFKNKKVSI